MYALYSFYGGWNRLYQFPASSDINQMARIYNKAKALYPNATIAIMKVEE